MTANPSNAIDKNSPEAYYLQLARVLRDQIGGGEFAMGDRLPSESELCRTYDLSRATVRQALRLLEEGGWVIRVARRGVFASLPKERGWLLQGPEGFFHDEVENRRRLVQTQVLRAEQGRLPAEAADALQLAPGSEGFILERVRRLDGEVALYSVNYLPVELGAIVSRSDVCTGEGSLNETLRRAGRAITGAQRTVEAVGATGEIAERLDVAHGTPVLHIRSTTWDAELTAFDHYSVWVLSNVVKLEVQAGSTGMTFPATSARIDVGRLAGPESDG